MYKIFLLLLTVQLSPVFNYELTSCDKRKCECSTLKSDNDKKNMRCPEIVECDVNIDFYKSKLLEIQCLNNVTYIDELEFNFGEVKTVTITDCMLRDGLSIFQKWNLTSVKELLLRRSFDMKSPGVLTKSFFDKTPRSSFEKIFILSCNIETIEEDVFEGFNNMTELKFENNNLKLVKDIFKYMPKLRELFLHQNRIEKIPNGITALNLKKLYLNINKITELDENLFVNTPNLMLLELSANPIKKLPQNLLFNLKNLTTINFGFDGNIKITDLFKNNVNLLTVRFRGGNITISPEAFQNLLKLEQLNIYNSKLVEIPANLFNNNRNLQTIKITESNLTSLPNNLFANLNNLKTIDLSANKLSEWKQEYELPNLTELFLNKNALKNVTSLTKLPKLQVLSLNKNNIESLPREAFNINSELRKIYLDDNKLWNVEEDTFNYLTKLEELHLNNNNFEEFPNINHLFHLTKINLRYNKIDVLQLQDILGFNAVIDLTGNLIDHLYFYIFEAANVTNSQQTKRLILNKNPFKCDCRAYKLLNWIKRDDRRLEIILDRCSLPDSTKSLLIKDVKLHELKCNLNSLTQRSFRCPENCICNLYPINSTYKVDCRNLGLKNVPRLELLELNYGEVLYRNFSVNLSGNKIESFGENDDYLRVTHLDLSGNYLKNITWVSNQTMALELHGNRLERLQDDFLKLLRNLTTLKRLTLDGNPWSCNCSLADLTYAARTTFRNTLKNSEKLLCSDKRQLIHLTETELCKDFDIFIILITIAAFFLITTTVLAVLYFKHETTIKIWLYSNNVLLKYVAQQDVDKQKKYDAFVSYSHKDESFVLEHLLPELEGGSSPYKLCYHERDWEVGEFINRQIIDSVANSRRTIIVLSKNFLESTWATVEFRTAHTQAMNEKLNRLIVILYDDVKPDDIQDEELKTYLKTTTYIKWGDPWFWKKLRYAMPHRLNSTKIKREEKAKKKIENIMISIDDRIDLTKSISTPNTQTPPAISLDPLLLKASPLEFKSKNEQIIC